MVLPAWGIRVLGGWLCGMKIWVWASDITLFISFTYISFLMGFRGNTLTFVSLVAAFCFIYTCHGLELVHRAALRSFKLLCWECGQQASERFPFIAWYLYRVWHVSRTEVGLWRSHHGQKGFRSKKLSVGLRIGRFLIPDRWGHTYLNNAISVTTFSFPPNIDKMC